MDKSVSMKQARRQHRQYVKQGGRLSLKAWVRIDAQHLNAVTAGAVGKLSYICRGRA